MKLTTHDFKDIRNKSKGRTIDTVLQKDYMDAEISVIRKYDIEDECHDIVSAFFDHKKASGSYGALKKTEYATEEPEVTFELMKTTIGDLEKGMLNHQYVKLGQAEHICIYSSLGKIIRK